MEVTTSNLVERIIQGDNNHSLSTNDSSGLINYKPQLNDQGKEPIVLFFKSDQRVHRENKEPNNLLSNFITDGGIKERQEKYKDLRKFIKKRKGNSNSKTMNTFIPHSNLELTNKANKENSNGKHKTFTACFSHQKTNLKDSIVKTENNTNYRAINTNTNCDHDQSCTLKRMKEYIVPVPKKKEYCLTEENINENNSMNRKLKDKEGEKEDEISKTEKKKKRMEELTEKNKIIAMRNIQCQLENEPTKFAFKLEKKIDILTQNNIHIDSDGKEIKEEANEFNSEKKTKENIDDASQLKNVNEEDNEKENKNKQSFKEYEEKGICSNENNIDINKNIKSSRKSKKENNKEDSPLKSTIMSKKGRDISINNKQNASIETSEYLKEIFKKMPSKGKYSTTERLRNKNKNETLEYQQNSFRVSHNSKKPNKQLLNLCQQDKPSLIYDEEYNLIVKHNKKALKSEDEFNVMINENIRKEIKSKIKQEQDRQKKDYLLYEELRVLDFKRKIIPKKKSRKHKMKNEFYQGKHKHSKQSSSLSTQIDQNDYLNNLHCVNTIVNQSYCLIENNKGQISKEKYDLVVNENTKQGNIEVTRPNVNNVEKQLVTKIRSEKKKEESDIFKDHHSDRNNNSEKENRNSAILNEDFQEKVQKTIEIANELFSKNNLSNLLDENRIHQNTDQNINGKELKSNKDVNVSENSIIENNEINESGHIETPKKIKPNNYYNETFGKKDCFNTNKEVNNYNEEIKPSFTLNQEMEKAKQEELEKEKQKEKERLNALIRALTDNYRELIRKNVMYLLSQYLQKKYLYRSLITINNNLKQQIKKRLDQYSNSIHSIISKEKQQKNNKEIESLSYSNKIIIEDKEDTKSIKNQYIKENLLVNLINTTNNVFIKPIKLAILLKLNDLAFNEGIQNDYQEDKSDYPSKNSDSIWQRGNNLQIRQKEDEGQIASVSGENHTYLYESFEDKHSLLLYPNSAESDRLHRLCELIKKQRESMNTDSSHTDSFNENHNRTQQSAYYSNLSSITNSKLSIGAYSSKSSKGVLEISKMKPKKAFKKHLDEMISQSDRIKLLTQNLSSTDKENQSNQNISNSSTIIKPPNIERKESNELDISADKDITSGIDWEYTLTNKGSSRESERNTQGKPIKESQQLILEELNENDNEIKENQHNRELSLEKKINMIEIRDDEEVIFHKPSDSDLSDQNYNEYHNVKYDGLDNEENNQIKDNSNSRKKDDLFVFILEEDGKTDSNIFIEGTETITQGLIRNKTNLKTSKKNEHIKVNNRYEYDEYDNQITEEIEKQNEIKDTIEEILLPIDYSLLTKITDKQVDIIVNDLVSSLIDKEMLDFNISLLPKKRTLSKKEQEIHVSGSSSFGSSPSSPRGKPNLREDDFSSSQSMTTYGNSALMKTIKDIKKEVCLNIYKTKIAPLLINRISLEIRKNYPRIYQQISQPIQKHAELLMNGIQLKDDVMISESQGEIPYNNIPFISKDFLKEFKEVNMTKRNEENVIKDEYFDNLMNEALVDAANEIIENERDYGQVGTPLPWSIRSREIDFKFKNDDFSCQKLQNIVTKKLRALISFKIGLISENYDHFDVDQLNQDREKKFLKSITEELLEQEPVWKGLEKEETEVKLILNRVIMEQLLNEVVEILEHVRLSRKEPSIYQYKSIYSCEDIPRLSFQNHNYNENLAANNVISEDSAGNQNTREDTVNQ